VVEGVLDVRDWDFEKDGPVRLEGDWEVLPEGVLEGDAIRSAPASGDFVSVPWSEAHHKTRAGRDADDARWTELRVQIRVPQPRRGFSIELVDYVAESFFAQCVDEHGTVSPLRAGLASPSSASTYREGLYPWGDLAIAGDASCVFVVPRGARNRTVVLSTPQVDSAPFVPRRKLGRSALVLVNLALVGTFVAFCATMVLTHRRDPLARWSLAWAAFYLVRIVVVNRGLLLPLAAVPTLASLPWWRFEYVDLWLFAVAFAHYGEALVERRSPPRVFLDSVAAASTVLAIVGSYDMAKRALPLGQVAILAALGSVLLDVFRAPLSSTILLARAGIVVAVVGTAGTTASTDALGIPSVAFEFLGSTEPLFQMAILAVRAQEARRKAANLANATQHFVPTQFLSELGHDDVTTAKLGDAASRHVTVLFADIRNFTSMSERMSAAQTFAFLNDCLSRIGPHVRANGGFVDKYIGDAIMALFPHEPSDAVRAALAMQREVRAGNEHNPGASPLALGIGIHEGNVMMGTIGEAERFEVTVISDAVNVAARLESLTKQLGCTSLVSGAVFHALPSELRDHTRRLGRFVVKGKVGAVELFECYASDPDALRSAKDASRERWNEMLALYTSGNVESATAIAGDIRDACPEDGPANWWFMLLVQEASSEDGDVPSNGGVVLLDAK
jgi:class 3 adenylate cyclase